MPLQNRVDPFSDIHAVTAKGSCLGNRGILHDDQQNLTHYHRHKAWIICHLEFRGRKRTVMMPNNYTELFFLDEATALAAGHRPCAECNRSRYNEFKQLWQQIYPDRNDKIDNLLHQARFIAYRKNWRDKKRTYLAEIGELPIGTFITLEVSPQPTPYIVMADSLRPWHFNGYGNPIPRPQKQNVTVLTPEPTVRVLRAGYRSDIFI